MKKSGLFLFLYLLFAQFFLHAQIKQVEECFVHEAYLTQEYGNLISRAVPLRPPEKIHEDAPEQDDPQLQWIPGYWNWSEKMGDYIWVSGVWRNPPNGHQWIEGYWKKLPEGWVWIRGFWSPVNRNALFFITDVPPDSIDERVPFPPSPQEAYFWMPGYWSYEKESGQFSWISGRWEFFREHVIYIPGHYIWRENGYVFVPPYWDWPIEDLGIAYACVSIPPDDRENIYIPSIVLQQNHVISLLYPYWPNYLCFFRYHFHFHQDLWNAWQRFPPWWQWSTWWCFTWQDTWWLWWWWCHAGYPQPPWLNREWGEKIAPPNKEVLQIMQNAKPPVNVTANGVAGNYEIIKALQMAMGRSLPIMPSDPTQIVQIQELAMPKALESPPYFRPQGNRPVAQAPKKPFFGPEKNHLKHPPRRVKVPKGPFESLGFFTRRSFHPITKNEKQPLKKCTILALEAIHRLPQKKKVALEIAPPPVLPSNPIPDNPPDYQQFNTTTPSRRFPPSESPYVEQEPFNQFEAPSESYAPYQGTPPKYEYPQSHLDLQHLDGISSQYLPQENPPGPKAHQVPGDVSTEPFK